MGYRGENTSRMNPQRIKCNEAESFVAMQRKTRAALRRASAARAES
jgi:hypothetical protein